MLSGLLDGLLGFIVMGIIGWAFSISNRVSVLEADKSSIREFIKIQFDDVKRRLQSLENKIDRNHGDIPQEEE